MKQTGIFDIINGTPIVFAYEFPEPDTEEGIWIPMKMNQEFVENLEEHKSFRKEWEVESVEIIPENELGIIKKGQQVQFTETQPPTKDKRGKCKILKIL